MSRRELVVVTLLCLSQVLAFVAFVIALRWHDTLQ